MMHDMELDHPLEMAALLVAIPIIAGASAIRAMFFGVLGRGTAYLNYYPAVVLAALYGGIPSGLLATTVQLSCVSSGYKRASCPLSNLWRWESSSSVAR
jgi:hypothetical protein